MTPSWEKDEFRWRDNIPPKKNFGGPERRIFFKKPSLIQRIIKIFDGGGLPPLKKLDERAEAQQQKFGVWLQKAIEAGMPIEEIEKLFILHSGKDLKQLKEALLFLSENIIIEGEIGYGETMRSYVEMIGEIEDLTKESRTVVSGRGERNKKIEEKINSFSWENGLRDQVLRLFQK